MARERTTRSRAPLAAAAILDVLDRAASSRDDSTLPWPTRGASVGHFEPHAMRLLAARSRKGNDWGLLFEVVQGDCLEGPDDSLRWPLTIQRYVYGSRVEPGGRYLVDARPIGLERVLPADREVDFKAFAVPKSFDGVKLLGPGAARPLVLTDALVKKLALAPGRACSPRIEDWPSVIAVRARLAGDPAVFWSDPKPLVKQALRLADAEVILAADAFEHVSGPAFGAAGPDARLPSQSKVFQSLAAALVARDAKRFEAGRSNVDWRSQLPKRAAAKI